MNNDPNPLHPPGSWTIAQDGKPVKSSVAFATKELADNLARKMNKMLGVNNFSSIQKPLNNQDD